MRKFNKKGLAVAMSMALVISGLSFQPAEAAKKPKLSKKKATVTAGSSVKIKVKNAAKTAKVKWKTNKKSVAKITKKNTKGKKAFATVQGVKAGKAEITATYKAGKTKKKLTCTVTVKSKKVVGPDEPTASTLETTAPAASAPATNGPASATPAPQGGITTEQPTITDGPTNEPSENDYEFFNDYTLGWKGDGYGGGQITAYKDGKQVSLADAGADVYNKTDDNIFAQHIQNNDWKADKIILTPPIQYTTEDGKVNNVDSMLTNFSFVADPTAIDNTENDGKLYVYGTTEGIDYEKGQLAKNAYKNHSLTILSTQDMVNWTDEGTLDNLNLTNQTSLTPDKDKVKNKWGTQAWAPSGLKIDGDGDGEDEYYIFYTNGGAVGYVQGDSPTGPWKDDLGKVLFSQSTPNCSGVVWCFDPAVLVDDKGDAYVYFGGGVPDGQQSHPKTGRVCKIKFEEGTGKVLLDGEPQVLDNYYMFEDSEINQFNGKYFYSYCTNFNVPGSDKWIGSGQIAAYVSSDPMNIAFDPTGENGDQYTDEDGVYHHYLGTILNNPSSIYGESYNNHHHMQSYKGHDYIFYHSTILGNTLFRDNKQYRNLHVDEISVDEETDAITIEPTYTGASQIEDFDPYKNVDGSTKYINATTSASSAGVTSLRDDAMVMLSFNGSPMVLDEIDTGDWSCIKGVNFGENGLKNFGVELASTSAEGRIELFIDSPTSQANKVASIDVAESTDGKYVVKNTAVTKAVTGKHDVYFVFRGSDYKVATWIFSEAADATLPDADARPDVPTPTPVPTQNPNIKTGWNEDNTEYYLPLTSDYVSDEGGSSLEFDIAEGSVTLAYNGQYPGVWFTIPDDVSENFSAIEFTYKDATEGGFGSAVRYVTSSADEEINWGDQFPAGDGLQTWTIDLDSSKEFLKYKIFRNNSEDVFITITQVKLIK